MILVIGGTGSVGVYAIEHLVAKGYEVLATGSNSLAKERLAQLGVETVNLRMENVADFDKLPTEGIEAVVVLGALLPANNPKNQSAPDYVKDYLEVITIGMVNVLEYCRRNGISKVIKTTSHFDLMKSWARGVALLEDAPRNFPFTGDHAPYVIANNAAVEVMEYYNQQYGFKTCVFRLATVYGVGSHGSLFVDGTVKKSGIQTFVENASQGLPIELWGDVDLSRDLVYVKDVAQAIEKAIASPNAVGVYTIASGVAVTLEQQIKTIIQVFSDPKQPSTIIYRPEKTTHEPSNLYSIEKARRDFGYAPEYSDYEAMMVDYKRELESGRFQEYFGDRALQSSVPAT
ncbi:MAG: NAD(P)-dependent oxidoreductase [Coriobacteriales bacterium]|jgi:UDP-glucose 4-epimerase|nr:NAD(P)-dependent oxidoreductase [Coriobacteriales bacterium]